MSASRTLTDRVLIALADGPGTTGEIAIELSEQPNRVSSALCFLANTGRIARVGQIMRGATRAVIYALPEHATAQPSERSAA